MNRLEATVRPILSVLIQGDPVALDHEQTTIIAKWIALKCIVAEHSQPNNSLTPKADRVALRVSGTIPPYFRIYLASADESRISYIRHAKCLALTPEGPRPPLLGTTKNIQTITFYIGRVFVHLNAARIDNFTLESRVFIPALYSGSRIWPPEHCEMVWPSRPVFTREQIASISLSLEDYTNNSVTHWGGDLE